MSEKSLKNYKNYRLLSRTVKDTSTNIEIERF